MAYSLSEAAKAVGLSRPTIFRAIKSGRISATRRDDGSYEIDASELFRAFPPVSDDQVTTPDMKQSETAVLRAKIDGLREQVALLLHARDDLTRRLDQSEAERRGAQERLTALLTDARPRRRRLWPWGWGGRTNRSQG